MKKLLIILVIGTPAGCATQSAVQDAIDACGLRGVKSFNEVRQARANKTQFKCGDEEQDDLFVSS